VTRTATVPLEGNAYAVVADADLHSPRQVTRRILSARRDLGGRKRPGLRRAGRCPPACQLGLDTTGNGHAIVPVGDPGTAANTVTYVPGLGSKLAGRAQARPWQPAALPERPRLPCRQMLSGMRRPLGDGVKIACQFRLSSARQREHARTVEKWRDVYAQASVADKAIAAGQENAGGSSSCTSTSAHTCAKSSPVKGGGH